MAAVHSGGVEGEGDVAVPVDGNQSAGAAEFFEPSKNHFFCGFNQTQAVIFHESGEVIGKNGADDELAVPGGGDGASTIIGVGSGSDDRESPIRP